MISPLILGLTFGGKWRQAKEVKRLTEQLSVVVAAAAEQEESLAAATTGGPSAAADPELASRMDQLQDQMKELVALKMSDVNERESEMSGFQSEILRQNGKFEAAMTGASPFAFFPCVFS